MLETHQKDLEQTILVGLITADQDADKSNEYLDELAFLTHTAGGEVVKRFTQKMDYPNSATFVGTGKVETLKKFIEENGISTAIFDDELSAAQERNLSKILNCKVLDRTNLILDIFAQRAKTSYARTQVELAQCEYLLPRLRGMWTHLERQKGGIGMRGPGETEIETDRRIVRDRIGLLKAKLKTIDKQMAVQRGNRGKMVRVALVGYTNVGKSTLMNSISKSEVFAEDKLFATLDTTVRKVVVKNLPFLLSDTVGFIRKLPTQLVESFKSTLDEVREADFLIHVVDLSHPNFQDHMDSVNTILIEIGCPDKPTLVVFNKIDNYKPEPFDETDLTIERSSKHYSLKELESSWMANLETPAVFVSVTEQLNMEHLKEALYQAVKQIHVTRFPYNHFLYPDDLDDLV
jgi:GTPase